MNLNLTSTTLRTVAALAVCACLTGSAQSTNRVDPKSFDAFKLVIERNIFDVNRRPPRIGIQLPPRQVDSFTLAGTMNLDGSQYAVFDGTSSEYHKALAPGGRISQYTVKEITHDLVKLVSGTNEIELKVGMQCRRSEDGKWSVGEGSDSSSYAYNSRSRNFGRTGFDRGYDRSNNDRGNNDRGGRNNFRNGSRTFGGAESRMGTTTSAGSSDSSNPNDIIARMMANRAAQVGENQGDNTGMDQGRDQNPPGGYPVDNPVAVPIGGEARPEFLNPIPNVPNQNDNLPTGNPGANQDNSPDK